MRKLPTILICLMALAGMLGINSVTANAKSASLKKTLTQTYNFMHGGHKRIYSIYIPAACNQSKIVPLVVALHGGGGSAEKWPEYTNYGFERLADKEHFILVYPNGIEGFWNDGNNVERYYSHKNNIDDVGFLSNLIDYLIETYPIDRNRVYVTGASNGGMMAHVLAGKHADKIAAIATVISSIPKNSEGQLYPGEPISVLIINGTEDPLIRWEGGPIKFGRHINGSVISTEQTVQFWVKHDKCNPYPEISDFADLQPDDDTTVKRTVYTGGRGKTEVILYTIIGGGHTWPAYQDKRKKIIKKIVDRVAGNKSRDMDACEVIWDFFKNHPKKRDNR